MLAILLFGSSDSSSCSLEIFKTSSGSINRFFLRKLREIARTTRKRPRTKDDDEDEEDSDMTLNTCSDLSPGPGPHGACCRAIARGHAVKPSPRRGDGVNYVV